MADQHLELPELLSSPSDRLAATAASEKLRLVNERVGATPHSTRELNMMAALSHPIYQEDGVIDYINEIASLEPKETPVQVASDIIAYYQDAMVSREAMTKLLTELQKTGEISPFNNIALATLRRHEDTVLFMHMPDRLNNYLDDDYQEMNNADYATLLNSNKDKEHLARAIEATADSEQDRAAFWLSQITGLDTTIDGQHIIRRGLIDSPVAGIQSRLATLARAGRVKPPAEHTQPDGELVFAIGRRPELGDTKAWEKFIRRNRLFDIRLNHKFLPFSNKEAYKIKKFDQMNGEPAAILAWMDMINESNRRWEVAKGKEIKPKERLDKLVARFDHYADDAADNVQHMDFVLSAIDDKSDEMSLFKDAFPADDWFRDYPEQRLPFTRLVEFMQTENFVEDGFVDTITDRARTKNKPSVQDEIDEIMSMLGELPISKVAEIAERFSMDQTNRFNYWKSILEMTMAHSSASPVANRALFRLAAKAPRYTTPDDPSSVIEPTYTKDIPF